MSLYFEQRMLQLGITDELNQVKLWQSCNKKDDKGVIWSDKELQSMQVFRKHEKGIEIIVPSLDRYLETYTSDDSRFKKRRSIIRLEKPIVKANGDSIKYLLPKGQDSYPFFPPSLIDKFEGKIHIPILFLTEGFFKAFKGSMHGIDIVGMPSITHLRNKGTGGLHPDLIRLIQACNVKRVIWLTDGDCLDVSHKALNPKEEIDLYKRPSIFYSSVSTFKQCLDDYDVDKYFMHPDSDAIYDKYKDRLASRDQVKGLDDILIAFPELLSEIAEDIKSVSKNGFWFRRFNISTGMSKVRDHFRLGNVNTFILFQDERLPGLKNKEFIFNGTKYRYNEDKGECEVMVPGDARLYFRVGDYYYEWVQLPNQHKQLEKVFHERLKTTIQDDHGKNFFKHILKCKAFCNVPDHINHQQIINNCFNVYSQIDYIPEELPCTEEDCPTILRFLHHIFGDRLATYVSLDSKEKKSYKTIDLGLDYLQLLYQQPSRKLPILCLVSKENNTGKSTFVNFLRIMLGFNVAIVGNQDLISDFNAHWATKSVVACDETKIDKQHVIEKIKSLSTAKKIWVNAKGKGQVELDCFIKFILISNNEDNFIYASDDDIRYWVIKVPVLKSENPHIVDQFVEEMPAFLSFLSQRKLVSEDKNRMWFHPSLLKTEALRKVIQQSMPTIQKELLTFIRDKFLDFNIDEFLMTRQAVHKECFNNRYEASYLEKVLKENLKVDLYYEDHESEKDLFGKPLKVYKTKRHTYPKWDIVSNGFGSQEMARVDVSQIGRPYVFKRNQFFSGDEFNATFSDESGIAKAVTPESLKETESPPQAFQAKLYPISEGLSKPNLKDI
jgi:hypothetical protein